jgi:hypothetical protein
VTLVALFVSRDMSQRGGFGTDDVDGLDVGLRVQYFELQCSLRFQAFNHNRFSGKIDASHDANYCATVDGNDSRGFASNNTTPWTSSSDLLSSVPSSTDECQSDDEFLVNQHATTTSSYDDDDNDNDDNDNDNDDNDNDNDDDEYNYDQHDGECDDGNSDSDDQDNTTMIRTGNINNPPASAVSNNECTPRPPVQSSTTAQSMQNQSTANMHSPNNSASSTPSIDIATPSTDDPLSPRSPPTLASPSSPSTIANNAAPRSPAWCVTRRTNMPDQPPSPTILSASQQQQTESLSLLGAQRTARRAPSVSGASSPSPPPPLLLNRERSSDSVESLEGSNDGDDDVPYPQCRARSSAAAPSPVRNGASSQRLAVVGTTTTPTTAATTTNSTSATTTTTTTNITAPLSQDSFNPVPHSSRMIRLNTGPSEKKRMPCLLTLFRNHTQYVPLADRLNDIAANRYFDVDREEDYLQLERKWQKQVRKRPDKTAPLLAEHLHKLLRYVGKLEAHTHTNRVVLVT